MEDHLKRAELAEALTPTISKRPRPDVLEESPLLLPSSESLEKINLSSESRANSDPSASSTSENGNNYYVFLSFRGPDTRKGFVDHLYQRLKAVGLRCHPNPVFRDDEDLSFGEDIATNLISAITHSKVLIPVISENYAAREGCLRELIHIMKCKESRGQIVLPVLYKVKLKHVRELKGAFGKAFESGMHLFEEDVKQQGPEALRKAVDSRVFESEKFADGCFVYLLLIDPCRKKDFSICHPRSLFCGAIHKLSCDVLFDRREGELVNELVEVSMRQQQDDFPPSLPMELVGTDDKQTTVLTPSSSSEMGGQHEDAKAPASSPSVIGNDYHVFLSFRGPDTHSGFIDHLYHRLQDVGLNFHPNSMFGDDEKLPFGEPIAENLLNAIECSKVLIPFISENYAASEWCLLEFIHIMECKESRGQIVLPVLYKVKPKNVRHLGGSFGKAFESCKDQFDEEVKQQGPKALRKALDLRVFESEKFADGREGELVKELVQVITDEQQHDFLPPLPGKLVGIDDRVAEVMKLLDTSPSEIQMIGICGIGGIGKTTLVTNIYNKLAKKFGWRSFLMDVRETINRKGVEHIQSLLLSDITKNHESRVRDSMMGIKKIRLSCEKKKVLILLDDVGHQDHIDNLIGGCNFELGSRIIITRRDKTLLKSEYKSYELKEMNSMDSMLLFSLYAFEAKQPPLDFTILSSDIVATTGGLPLALEIIGSFLKRKDKSIRIETLENLRKVPHTNAQENLKISYNALEHNEKQMFLDIACFFIGYEKRFATYLWKDLQLRPNSRLAKND